MIGELLDSKGYNAILMVVDRLSKQIHAIPTVTSLDSTRVAWLFLEHIWHHHGLLEEVISDHGSTFISNFLAQLATGCVTCHACHGCVTDFRPILGNPMEVTHVTS